MSHHECNVDDDIELARRLASMTKRDALRHPGVGKARIANIAEWLASFDLKFQPDRNYAEEYRIAREAKERTELVRLKAKYEVTG